MDGFDKNQNNIELPRKSSTGSHNAEQVSCDKPGHVIADASSGVENKAYEISEDNEKKSNYERPDDAVTFSLWDKEGQSEGGEKAGPNQKDSVVMRRKKESQTSNGTVGKSRVPSDVTEAYPEEIFRNYLNQSHHRSSLVSLDTLKKQLSRHGSSLSIASSASVDDKENALKTQNSKLSNEERRTSLGRRLSGYTASRYKQMLTQQQSSVLQTFSSVNYRPTHSQLFLEWLAFLPRRLNWDRWLVTILIGVAIGIMFGFLKQCLTALDNLKWEVSREYAQNDELGLMWATVAGIALVFGLVASFLVTVIQPQAAGSGVPEVISFLNGVIVHGALRFKTFIVKFFALVFTVSSGLPCGLQGPLIAMGAIIGNGIGQFKLDALHLKPKIFDRLRNSQDRRSFTTAGVAAGVAAGFNAPIGGLLFAMEDLSSFWTKSICWHTFFCSAIAALTANLINTAFSGFKKQEDFGLVSLKVIKPLQISILILIPAACLGLVGGLLGATFTRGNVKLVATRKKLMAAIKNKTLQSAVRMTEVTVLVLIMVTTATVLPTVFDCSEGNKTSDILEQDKECRYEVPFTRTLYNCPETEENATTIFYNEFATLIQGSGSALLDKLWSRDTYDYFSYWPLLSLLPIWYLMTMWTCGSAIAGGIFVPTLVSGSLYGRLLGLGLFDWLDAADRSDTKEWLDPGALAVIGAGSLLGGVTRLNVAVTVIVVEMSRDLELAVPVLFSIWVAKLVADLLAKPLYMYQLDGKGLPFLNAEPIVVLDRRVINLEFYRAKDVMSRPVFTLKSLENIRSLAKVLLDTAHGGYPVCKYDPDTRKELAYGLITRTELYVLLTSEDLVQDVNEGAVVEPKVTHDMMSQDYLKETDEGRERLQNYVKGTIYRHVFLNLEPFISQSVYKVDEEFSLSRTYEMFRLLGLRHILVTDLHNAVTGVITRKDLVPFNIQQSLATLEHVHTEEELRDEPDLGIKHDDHSTDTRV